MAKPFRFDPDRVAYYEANGWRAYYDHAWFRLLRLMLGISQEQFGIPFPRSLLAAYYVARAARAWAPTDHDQSRVVAYNTAFYRLARRYSGLHFDPARAGALETAYNDVHRRLSGQADKTEFIETMVQLHSELFSLPPAAVRKSAELRVRAATTVDRITSHTSTDVAGDWRRVEADLRACYRSVERAMHAQTAPAGRTVEPQRPRDAETMRK